MFISCKFCPSPATFSVVTILGGIYACESHAMSCAERPSTSVRPLAALVSA